MRPTAGRRRCAALDAVADRVDAEPADPVVAVRDGVATQPDLGLGELAMG
jgi:hypothetical protein